MPSQEIQNTGDGPFGGPRNCSVWHFSSKLDVPSNVVQKKGVARILVFKIRPSQEILKIRDGTPLEAEGILTYRKSPRNCSGWHFSSKLDVPSNVLQKKRVARILVFKIRPSQEILKIRDGTPLEADGILTYRKSPRNCSVWHFSSKLDVPSNVLQKKGVARILVFKIRPSQEILKIRDGTPLEAEGILTYRKSPRNCSGWHFSSKLDVPSNVLQKKEWHEFWRKEFLHTEKGPRNCSVWHFSSKLNVPSNVVQKKRVAQILVFKIRPSQEILKIRDGTPLEADGILTYRKSPRNCSVWHFFSKLDVPSNVLQKKRVARILVFKIRPSQEIQKIRDGTPLEAEGILTYRKRPSKLLEIQNTGDGPFGASPRNCSVWHFSSKLDVPSNVVQKKGVARILVFKIRPSQEILKIRDGTPLEAEGILTYRKSPRNCSGWHFSSKLDVPSNVLQKKRVARILVFKIRPSQEILKIRDGTPLEADGILTYRKSPRNCSVWHFSSKLDVPSNVLQKKRVARILVFKIRPSQEILKIRDGTPLEAEGILTYRKSPRNCSGWHFSSKLDVPSNVLQKKRVARILVFKIRPSQEILKIRDGTPLEAEGIFTYRKRPSKLLEILKIRDGTPLEKKGVARILVFKIRPSQEILKIRDGTPLEAEGILTYRKSLETARVEWYEFWFLKLGHLKKFVMALNKFKKLVMVPLWRRKEFLHTEKGPRNCSVWHFSSKLDVPSNVVQKKGVAQILVFKIRPSQEILKIRDGTPLEADGILTYRKSPRNCSGWHFSSKLDDPSNVLHKKRVVRILVFKIRPSQEIRDGPQQIQKIGDGTPLEAEGIFTYRKSNVVQKKGVARILVFKIRPSQEILKIRDGTPLEADGILTYRKSPRNCSVWHFFSKLDVPSNVLQKKRVARILVFKIRPSQEILKIRDGTPLEAEGILTYRKSLETARVGTFLASHLKKFVMALNKFKKLVMVPLWRRKEFLHTEKGPRNCSVWHFSSKLDVPSNVVQKKRVAQILVFKIRPSQEILKIRDGTPLEADGILTYRKSPRNCSVWHFFSKLDVPSNVLQKKRVARILVFKIRPSQEILKIRDGTPLEAEGILTYRKRPSKLLGLALF
ncbi:hypothetical protein OROMI_025640 [Orobanche minor]